MGLVKKFRWNFQKSKINELMNHELINFINGSKIIQNYLPEFSRVDYKSKWINGWINEWMNELY